jgi:hypothetical protein
MHVGYVVGEFVLRCHILDRWAGMMWNIMIDLPARRHHGDNHH